ncbi:MAG: hypothetical protein N3A38_01325, partial [Planctomycetota bacterium]|nr:hypothetical protein [Planctomycetota bacterium]
VERAREAMKALRLGRARAELDAALEIYRRYRRRDEEVRVEPLRADLKWLEALLAEITRRSDAGLPPIERITMPSGESLPVMAISPEGIRVRDADEKARIIPLESVTPDQLQRILEGCGLRGEGRLGAAALWFHRGLPALAEKELKEAKRENPRLRDDRDVAAFEERLRKGATED